MSKVHVLLKVLKVLKVLQVLRVLKVLGLGISGYHSTIAMGLLLSNIVDLLHPTQCCHHGNVSSSLSVEHRDHPSK
jgi:hypothetical protein